MAPESECRRQLTGTPKEVAVEQQSGASGAAQAQAARTILPGEPFEPPAAFAGPRSP